MYKVIKGHSVVSSLYAKRLEAEGVIDANWADEHAMRFVQTLEQEFTSAADYNPNAADWFGGRWSGLSKRRQSN